MTSESDRWSLSIAGRRISRCIIDYSLALQFDGFDQLTIYVRCPFTLRMDERDQIFDPEGDPQRLGPALGLLRRTALGGYATYAGDLYIEFEGDCTLSVEANSDYEAWEIVSSTGLRVVPVPGSQLAIWLPHIDESISDRR